MQRTRSQWSLPCLSNDRAAVPDLGLWGTESGQEKMTVRRPELEEDSETPQGTQPPLKWTTSVHWMSQRADTNRFESTSSSESNKRVMRDGSGFPHSVQGRCPGPSARMPQLMGRAAQSPQACGEGLRCSCRLVCRGALLLCGWTVHWAALGDLPKAQDLRSPPPPASCTSGSGLGPTVSPTSNRYVCCILFLLFTNFKCILKLSKI